MTVALLLTLPSMIASDPWIDWQTLKEASLQAHPSCVASHVSNYCQCLAWQSMSHPCKDTSCHLLSKLSFISMRCYQAVEFCFCSWWCCDAIVLWTYELLCCCKCCTTVVVADGAIVHTVMLRTLPVAGSCRFCFCDELVVVKCLNVSLFWVFLILGRRLGKGMRRSKNQWRKASFHWMVPRHSVNEGVGKEFYRKGSSLKRLPLNRRTLKVEIFCAHSSPFPNLRPYNCVLLLSCCCCWFVNFVITVVLVAIIAVAVADEFVCWMMQTGSLLGCCCSSFPRVAVVPVAAIHRFLTQKAVCLRFEVSWCPFLVDLVLTNLI